MESIVLNIVESYGILGLFICCILWLIWDRYKEHKKRISSEQSIDNNQNDIKTELTNITSLVNSNIKYDEEKYSKLLLSINTINNQLNSINDRVSNLEILHTTNINNYANLIKQLNLSPKINTLMLQLLNLSNTNHVFFCSMHNHNESIQGIPYYKFTCLIEKYQPSKYPEDIDLCTNWKDINIFTHGQLPLILYQEEHIEFYYKDDKLEQLNETDDTIYRLAKRLNIKQLAFHSLKNVDANLIGFIGMYTFNDDIVMNLEQLNNISKEIENIFNNIK